MRSFSRNGYKPYRALGLAGALLLLGSAAQAADPSHDFVLTVYSNGAGGEELLSGDYQGAAEALHHPGALVATDASTASNRCVTLAMTKQWESARQACDQAVREAQQEKALLPSYQYWARALKNDNLAVALSNRAVLHWIAAEAGAAASDLKRAEVLSPHADFVVRNRAAMAARTAATQVAAAPVGH